MQIMEAEESGRTLEDKEPFKDWIPNAVYSHLLLALNHACAASIQSRSTKGKNCELTLEFPPTKQSAHIIPAKIIA